MGEEAGYLGGRSIAGLARDHHVSRDAIRIPVAAFVPEHITNRQDIPAPETAVTLDMPGKVARFLRAIELEPVERTAPGQEVAVRRGQGYTLRVTAVPAVHRQLLARCQPLDGAQGVPAIPAQRKACHGCENRVGTLVPPGP
ncbi:MULTISPECIES: resolvase [unclassified Streptomyces]|uniref:resolvase n=1 Tax=unclassified Streptomyces TaxID=2593676 RepID=UPI0035E0A82E